MSALNSNEDLSRPPAVVVDDDENGSDSNLHSNDNRRTANATSSNSKITLSSTSPFKLEDDASATAAAAANRTDATCEPFSANATIASSLADCTTTITTTTTTSSSSSPATAQQQLYRPVPLRICLVGTVASDAATVAAARSFDVPVVTSETGDEFATDTAYTTFFIVPDFDGPVFRALYAFDLHQIMGAPALQYHQQHKRALANVNKRPVYNYSMNGMITCFSGIRCKVELTRLVHLIHSMGGSIRKDTTTSVTHLISVVSGGEKFLYAKVFNLEIVRPSWVHSAWENRDAVAFVATKVELAAHRLRLFEGLRICFLGFAEDEHEHMTEVLLANGGTAAQIDDPKCTHVVTDTTVQTKPEPKNESTYIVKPEWFWYCIQKGFAEEKDHLFKDYLESIAESSTTDRRESLPGNFSPQQNQNNKRKRKLLSQKTNVATPSGTGKRRSSVSDAGLLSATGSLLDYTASPSVMKFDAKKSIGSLLNASATEPKKKSMRYNHFMDLFSTESNYVGILQTIVTLFQEPLERMVDKPDALLNQTEVRAIFNNFSPIHDVHKKMLNKFQELQSTWSEDCLIGKIICDHREALIKAYPPYVNFFEQMRDALVQCDSQYPCFHAFLKINQAKAECGRQTLQDLMIRPVQRLPSICLLISDILKHTPKTNPDYKELEQALRAIKEVMTYINEDKRKTECRLLLFDIFNDIEGCPPDLVASHRKLINQCEVTELSNTLSGRDDVLKLFLFTDYMEVCKVKKSRFNQGKSSPITTNSTATLSGHGTAGNGHTLGRSGASNAHPHQKSYKHVKLLSLTSIGSVCDIQDGARAFALCAAQKDKVYAFNINDNVNVDKRDYLKELCKQLAEKTCRPDANEFLQTTNSADLNIDISDLNLGTLKKAFNYARTRLKVTRAFSFNKTPMKLTKRPAMSPQFGSTNSLTPASQLAKMKLASCTNINEVGNEDVDDDDSNEDSDATTSSGTKNGSGSGAANTSGSSKQHHLVAPMSVQPVRKAKCSMDALRRL